MSDPENDRLAPASAIHRELLRMAVREDELAAAEVASVPYWAPVSPTVQGHRAAAALRSEADRLLSAS